MEAVTVVVIVAALLLAVVVSALITSRVIGMYFNRLYEAIGAGGGKERESAPVTEPKVEAQIKAEEKPKPEGTKQGRSAPVDEEELVKRIRQMINERISRLLDEAKAKKSRILTLLDFARGYALGFVSEEEYNAFLERVLNELEEFKRLWIMKYPSKKDKEQLEVMIGYVAKTKLPITIKAKDKGVVRLSNEEALIKITEYLNSALSILDKLIERAGGDPAITPLEVRLSNEVKKLQEKVKRLEERLQEIEMSV